MRTNIRMNLQYDHSLTAVIQGYISNSTVLKCIYFEIQNITKFPDHFLQSSPHIFLIMIRKFTSSTIYLHFNSSEADLNKFS